MRLRTPKSTPVVPLSLAPRLLFFSNREHKRIESTSKWLSPPYTVPGQLTPLVNWPHKWLVNWPHTLPKDQLIHDRIDLSGECTNPLLPMLPNHLRGLLAGNPLHSPERDARGLRLLCLLKILQTLCLANRRHVGKQLDLYIWSFTCLMLR